MSARERPGTVVITKAVEGTVTVFSVPLAERGGCLDPRCGADHFKKPRHATAYVQALTCPVCGEDAVVGVAYGDARWLFIACGDCKLSLAVVPLLPSDAAAELAAASPPLGSRRPAGGGN